MTVSSLRDTSALAVASMACFPATPAPAGAMIASGQVRGDTNTIIAVQACTDARLLHGAPHQRLRRDALVRRGSGIVVQTSMVKQAAEGWKVAGRHRARLAA